MAGAFAISRRAFCAGLGAATLAPPDLHAAPEPSATHAYAGESGKFGTWPLVFGLLTTTAPERHAAQIETLRRRAGYPRALRYMSTDRAKVPFARSAIDYFADNPDLGFTAIVVRTPVEELASDFRGAMRQRLMSASGATAFHADRSNLAQLASFLAGCVYGAATGVRHPVKVELIARLGLRAGAATGLAASECGDSRFRIVPA